MRNFTRCVGLLLLVFATTNGFAQKQVASSPSLRCGAVTHLEALFRNDPQARARNEENQRQAVKLRQQYLSRSLQAKQYDNASLNTLSGPVYIPVVVHIVLPNAQQVSDLDVQRQIDRLNTDYAGLNADSSNIPAAFKSLFGKSNLRFTLARRSPTGTLTTGIERRNSSTFSDVNQTTDPIKRSSLGGLDAWDYNKYVNLWIGNDGSGLGVLGYATFPGTDLPENQGVFINIQAFGSNSCYVIPDYGMGRTLVHEMGHYFGLFHIWGDDSGGCSGDDFAQLPGTCLLPASLLIGDTPNQADNTIGCRTGVQTDACSPAAPGYMYQNFMDYTNDACYAMFTAKQVERLEYTLENCRASYLTSDGATPPSGAVTVDVSPMMVVNPGGSEISGCSVINYPGWPCAGSFSPKIQVINNGLDTIKNVKVGVIVDNGPASTVNVATNIPFGYTNVVTLPAITVNNGSHTLKFFTQDPNNTIDQVPINDTLTITVNVGNPTTGPIVEGFESPTFPPPGWSLLNPNLTSLTWERSIVAKKSGLASAFINLYNYANQNDSDYLISPLVDITGVDSVIVSFDRAYKRYNNDNSLSDTMMIMVGTGCGNSSFPIVAWKKGGNSLSTSPGTYTGNWAPNTNDWLRERVDIKPLLPAGTTAVQVAFVSKNRFGQNLWLDDINIASVILPKYDAGLRAITNPLPKACVSNFTPSVDITNPGRDPLTFARVVYRITGPSAFNVADSVDWTGNLLTGGVANVLLKPITLTTPGLYNMIVYTKLPNHGSDLQTSNDTIRLTFRFIPTVPAPVFEGFEGGGFPPANWLVTNQDGSGTWFRTTVVSNSGIASMVMDNYNYDAKGTNDDLESPQISYNGVDSVKLTFSLAHATYYYPGSTGIPLDTLQVLVTKDCGQTFTTVFNKWGEDLQTVNDPNNPFTNIFIPSSPTQWKQITVDLTRAFGSSGPAQIIIRSKGNYGNTVLIDNINITTKTLPLKLKMNGYLISPNPFSTSFSVQHYLKPANLRGIQVTNVSGQVVFSQNFNGNAQSYINIDLNRNAAGVYFVKLIYNDKVVTERVIKR